MASLFPAMGMIFCAEVAWKLVQSTVAVSAKENAIYAGWFLLEMLGFIWIIVKSFYLVYHDRSWDMLLGFRYLIMMVFGFVAAIHFFEAKTMISDELPADIFFLHVREALRESSLLLVFLGFAISRPRDVMPNPILEKVSFVFMGAGFILLAYFLQSLPIPPLSYNIGSIFLFVAGVAIIWTSLCGEMLELWNEIAEKGTKKKAMLYSSGKIVLLLSMMVYIVPTWSGEGLVPVIILSACFILGGGFLISLGLDGQESMKTYHPPM